MPDLIQEHSRLVQQYEVQSKALNQLKVQTVAWYQQLQAVTETGNALLAIVKRIDAQY